MNAPQALFQLPFYEVMDVVREWIPCLPPAAQYHLEIREFLLYLLEEVGAKLWDREASSSVDLAVAYLKRCQVEQAIAEQFSHHILNLIVTIITTHIPWMTFQDLYQARYVLSADYITLHVYTKTSP